MEEKKYQEEVLKKNILREILKEMVLKNMEVIINGQVKAVGRRIRYYYVREKEKVKNMVPRRGMEKKKYHYKKMKRWNIHQELRQQSRIRNQEQVPYQEKRTQTNPMSHVANYQITMC